MELIDAVRRDTGEEVFQSLVGFKINWNLDCIEWEVSEIDVSIPSRV